MRARLQSAADRAGGWWGLFEGLAPLSRGQCQAGSFAPSEQGLASGLLITITSLASAFSVAIDAAVLQPGQPGMPPHLIAGFLAAAGISAIAIVLAAARRDPPGRVATAGARGASESTMSSLPTGSARRRYAAVAVALVWPLGSTGRERAADRRLWKDTDFRMLVS